MTITSATITIEVDATGGVNFIVMGDDGPAKDIADAIMKDVIATQRAENYLGRQDYVKQ